MSSLLVPVLLLVMLVLLLAVLWRLFSNGSGVSAEQLEEKHRAMLADLYRGLGELSERTNKALLESADRQMNLQMQQGELQRTAMQDASKHSTETLTQQIGKLILTVEQRLEAISSRVNERLDEGFKKTNETFTNVMARLAVIDEAQKKIESLSGSVMTLQELLGDKRSRGAFGEVQLEHLVRNLLPEQACSFQHTLSTGVRADCMLHLPPPTGSIAVDAKFPLENYQRMFGAPEEGERTRARTQFVRDVKTHIEAIGSKYIIPGETADGAVMFIPAEAVFAEIHAHHAELVDYAQQHRVWIVSPTTLMAVLNTARAVLRDAQMREQLHVMQDELVKLAQEFGRFDDRMKNLADHIRKAHEDAQLVHTTSKKISQRFKQIERVELEKPAQIGLLGDEE